MRAATGATPRSTLYSVEMWLSHVPASTRFTTYQKAPTAVPATTRADSQRPEPGRPREPRESEQERQRDRCGQLHVDGERGRNACKPGRNAIPIYEKEGRGEQERGHDQIAHGRARLQDDQRQREDEQTAEERLTTAETEPAGDSAGPYRQCERAEQLVERDEVVVPRQGHRRERAELPTGRICVVAQIEDAAEIGDAAVLPPERRTYEMEGQDVVLDLRHPDSHRGRVRETQDHDDCENEQQPIAPQGAESGAPLDPATEAAAEQNGERRRDRRACRAPPRW